MYKSTFKKYEYNVTHFNHSSIRRLYFTYLHQTVFDKIVDTLVFFAVFSTFLTLVLELFLPISPILLAILHSFSVLILFIFGLELFRDYAHSENKKQFIKKHWLDLMLVGFLSTYLVTGTYFALARFNILITIEEFLMEFKYFKVSWRFITGLFKFW